MAENQDSMSQAADILVVDDTIASLRLLTEILGKGGYRVRPAGEPHLALQSALAEPPSLILLDVRMPGMDGFEVCRRLKQDERTRDVPVIFVSALHDVDDRVRGFEVGGVDFVSKPIEEAEVLARVKTHLLLWTMQMHLEELVAERTAELVQVNKVLRREIVEHKRAQEELAESRDFLAGLTESIWEAVFSVRMPDRTIDWASDSFGITGYDAQECVGRTTEFLYPSKEEHLDFGERLRIALDQGESVLHAEQLLRRKDGVVYPAEITTTAFRRSGEVYRVTSVVSDITERKRAEEALRESEERYRTLVEQAQDGIVVLQDDKIRFANSYLAALSGRTVKELLDTSFEAYLTADQLPQIAEIYRRRMSGENAPSIYEAAIQHRDGSRVEVEFNAGLTTYDGRPATLVFVRDNRERVKARQELEASQRLLSLVIDNVPAQISYVDKNQRYRFVNQRYEQAYGIPPSEFVGKPVSEILGPEGYAAAEPQITAALAGERISYEHVFHYPDRVQRWMSIDYVPDRHPAGDVQGFVGLVRDITEGKQAAEALRESEEKLRAIYEAIPVAAYTWQREGEDFVLVDYNEMAAKTTEGRIVDLVGKRASEMYRDLPEIPEAMARCSSERLTIEEEMDYQLITTGRRRYLNVKYAFAPPDLVVVHTEDITARKRAEEELRRSNERLEEAQRTAQIGDWEYDILAGKVTWSDEMFRIRGVDPEQYLPTAKSDEEFCHPDDVPALREAYERFFAGGEPLDLDYRIVTPQGVAKACRRRGRLIVDDRGTPSLAIGTTEDITERWLVEHQIKEYQQRLQTLVSLLTISEERERRRIARDLHDEVGQTLTSARIWLASAREAIPDAQRDAILDQVSQSLRQAIRDTRDLIFDLSSPLMNELGLGAALREWLEDQVGKKHGLQTELVYDGKRFPLDDDMRAILFRCTRELLTNVVKHAQAKRVTVRLEAEGTLVRIAVEDDGIGFDVDAIPGTMEREGGFGLFSIQERMADLGGSLEIQSSPGQGCTAILTAPVTIHQAPASQDFGSLGQGLT